MSILSGHEWRGQNEGNKKDAKDESNTAEIHGDSMRIPRIGIE
jgi:hypothetical protein